MTFSIVSTERRKHVKYLAANFVCFTVSYTGHCFYKLNILNGIIVIPVGVPEDFPARLRPLNWLP